MSKKRTKPKGTAAKLSAVEAENRREIIQLRRLRDQQRRIVELSRKLTAALRRADGARLNAARELCEDTGWDVCDVAEVESDRRLVEQLRERNKELLVTLTDAQSQFAAATVEIAQLREELNAFKDAYSGSRPA